MSTKQKKLEDFNDAKNALLNYYSSVQISLGERLLGFAVVLFALFQVASWSNTGLSVISTFKVCSFPIKTILFELATLILVLYMVRTAFRYASVSGYVDYIITLDMPESIPDSPHSSICSESYQKMVAYQRKVFFFFPFNWFFTGVIGSDHDLVDTFRVKSVSKGWGCSLLIAVLLTSALFWILQGILFK